jgi:hypothetical protein
MRDQVATKKAEAIRHAWTALAWAIRSCTRVAEYKFTEAVECTREAKWYVRRAIALRAEAERMENDE